MTTKPEPMVEWLKCAGSLVYFVTTYVWIYNATITDWIRFDLWPAQERLLEDLQANRQVVVLKARQLGVSWLVLAFCLWIVLFQAPASVLLFSLRQNEAEELLRRIREMYAKLPEWMQARTVIKSNTQHWELSNGSVVMAFPTTGGRSYTGTIAVVDEADFVPNLANFLNAVKPTTDAGGRLILVSTADKAKPLSTFKGIFRAAWRRINQYKAVFLSWRARPDRTEEWYRLVAADMRAQRGSDDDLHQEYPETPEEALGARSLDKRVPADWVQSCTWEASALAGGVYDPDGSHFWHGSF
jgi:hypothetical protein